MVSLPALLMAYFGARIDDIGVDAAGRTRENLAGAPPRRWSRENDRPFIQHSPSAA
jgi:hypothetical protein